MKVLVSTLHPGENRFPMGRDNWPAEMRKQLESLGFRLEKPPVIDFNLIKMEPDYYMRGKLEFAIEQICARCADPFFHSITHPFHIALTRSIDPGKNHSAKLGEETDELDITLFDGNELDLDEILLEQFHLSLPYQCVCSAECKGICQHCGKNRNTEPCSCQDKPIPSAFEALEQLRTD